MSRANLFKHHNGRPFCLHALWERINSDLWSFIKHLNISLFNTHVFIYVLLGRKWGTVAPRIHSGNQMIVPHNALITYYLVARSVW